MRDEIHEKCEEQQHRVENTCGVNKKRFSTADKLHNMVELCV